MLSIFLSEVSTTPKPILSRVQWDDHYIAAERYMAHQDFGWFGGGGNHPGAEPGADFQIHRFLLGDQTMVSFFGEARARFQLRTPTGNTGVWFSKFSNSLTETLNHQTKLIGLKGRHQAEPLYCSYEFNYVRLI